MATMSVMAVPARRGLWKTITLKDGSSVMAMLKGDETLHYYESQQGTRYVASADNRGFYVEANADSLNNHAQQRRAAVGRRQKSRLKTSTGGVGNAYLGVKKGLIILTQFSDKTFQSGHDQAKYNDIANKQGYATDDGFVGSVRDYFEAQSGGLFYIDFDVVGPVTLNKPYSYYGKNNRLGNDMHAGQMVAEACQAADGEVDFNNYDWDGDGEADQVYVLYAGYGEASCDDENTVWPHMWNLSYSDYGKALSLDGVTIDTYACSNEMEYYEAGGTGIAGIGSICHEFSHCLGFPDLYDTDAQTNFGMSYWDLMDSGCYNGDTFRPAGYTSYEKMVAGWLSPIELTGPTAVEGMKAQSEGGDAYIIYNEANRNEFFMLENRQLSGWDAALYGHGLLVLHVDYDETAWYNNTVNNVASRQRCTIFHADNSDDITISGLAGDPYPYLDNDSLTDLSCPQATLYNTNSNGTKLMGKGIYGIKQNQDQTVSFSFMSRDATGIVDAKAWKKNGNGAIYTLGGQRVRGTVDNLPKGVYIIEGRKVVR